MDEPSDPVGFKFGDSRALNARLIDLVRQGFKTASCGALRDFEAEGEPLPEPGRRDIAMDWDGKPALVIETTEVTLCRFRDVPEEFALAEGEGDFETWRRAHIDFFTRNGGYDPDMMLVCERFRLIRILT
ncbi:MAG: ASCH domain-containing protein [Paracoccus sp. (in: a-proteobacteria)]